MNAPIVMITKITDMIGEKAKSAPPKKSSKNVPTNKPTNPINKETNAARQIFFIQSRSFVKLELAYFLSFTKNEIPNKATITMA